MSEKIMNLELQNKNLSQEKTDYEELLQQNRYNMKEICVQSREKDKLIDQYKDIIQKLANSHQVFQD